MAETAQPFACGGISACLASAVVHPIDLAKVRLQLFALQNPGLPKPSFSAILSKSVKENGFFSIYDGLSASFGRQAVYGTARIGLHRTISNEVQTLYKGEPLPFLAKVACGMSSGAIAVCIGTPFDVALVRMQADSMKPVEARRGYKNVVDAIRRVAREEGFLALYSGIGPNILRGMALNAGQLSCFDQAKEFIQSNVFTSERGQKASLKTQLGAACIAGFTATAFSLPFDLLKSRLQDGAKYKGLSDAFLTILRTEGPLAFWTGFGAYYMRTAPHAMIILMSTEPIVAAYRASLGLEKK